MKIYEDKTANPNEAIKKDATIWEVLMPNSKPADTEATVTKGVAYVFLLAAILK